MKKFLLSAAVLTVSAGAAIASPMSATGPTSANKVTVPGGNVGAPRGATNSVYSFDVSGINSFDAVGTAGNTVVLVDLGAWLGNAGSSVTMTSIGWDVTGEALGASWASEMRIYFDDNIAPDLTGLFLSPLFGNSTPGTFSANSGGQLDLTDNAIPNIVLANGILRLEFHESFDDVPGAVDGIWRSGVLTIGVAEVPAPGAAAVFGLAGLAGLRRRR